MVIASAGDSTNTLVSLDRRSDGLKRAGSYAEFYSAQPDLATETQIRLPAEEDDETNNLGCCMLDQQDDCFLYLPSDDSGIDECLQYVPALQEANDDLLNRGILQLTGEQRFLYVAQGEIAHCTSSQNDFLVSDKATTCHILALRSCSSDREALCTLTHIDGTGYATSLRAAVDEHASYHGKNSSCQLDIHVAGGYKDLNGTSRDLSNWLMQELATLADEYLSVEFTLQTACITSMNTCSSSQQPLVRGLARDCRTGQVWMAHCPSIEQQGPAPVQRAARLWVQHGGAPQPTLHCIFTHQSIDLVVQPYNIVKFKGLESLLRLPDHVLLQYCSTSPDVEEDDFCPTVRRTLCFLKENANTTLDLLRFRRCGKTNKWVACC